MSDAAAPPGEPDFGDGSDEVSDPKVSDPEASDAIPDESRLMGKVGVEAEVLAELARAEAKMSDPLAPDDPDAAGAQV